MNTEQRVRNCLVEKLGLEEEDVTLDANFRDDLGLDSLELVEAAMAFEEEFELEVPNENVDQFKTVGDAVRYVDSHITETATLQT